MNYVYLRNFRDATLYELRNAVSLAAQDLRISLGEARLQNKLYKDLTGLNVELYNEIDRRIQSRS